MSDGSAHVVVASIVERDGRFLIVEERINGAPLLNQPAGHWERGETLAAHCERWLDGAQQKIDAMTAGAADGD